MLSWWHWMLLMIKPLFYPKSKHSMSCIVNFLGSSSNWWRPWHSKSSREKGHKSSKQHTIILAKPSSSSCCDSIMGALEFFWAFYDQDSSRSFLLCKAKWSPFSSQTQFQIRFRLYVLKIRLLKRRPFYCSMQWCKCPKIVLFHTLNSISLVTKEAEWYWKAEIPGCWYNGPRRLLMEMR